LPVKKQVSELKCKVSNGLKSAIGMAAKLRLKWLFLKINEMENDVVPFRFL
jgi:hypothetical protein